MEEEISLCQNCDWSSHAAPASAASHKQQSINCYSGCPSASELSRIWLFFSMDDSSCKHETGSMSLEEEDQSLLHCQLMPLEYSRVEDAMDPTTSDADRICGNDSLNLLDEKVASDSQFLYIAIQLQIFNTSGTQMSATMLVHQQHCRGMDRLFICVHLIMAYTINLLLVAYIIV